MYSNYLTRALLFSAIGLVLLYTPYDHAASFNSIKTMPANSLPASAVYKRNLKRNLPPAPFIIAPKLNIPALDKEDRSRESQALPYRFAVPIALNTDFTKTGKWEIQGNTAIWRMQVTSENAQSFNFGLKNVFLPAGTRLFFYNDNYSIILGPYTEKDNKTHGELWTPVIESKKVTIEINIPVNMRPYLKFEIARINRGYRGIKNTQIAKSGSCNNDVICSAGDAWRNEIRSVARYTIDGTGMCTGTLINNARGDYKPYFLSAGHCGVNTSNAASLVFYWNYETSTCQGTPDGQLNQFSNGSTFRASSSSGGVVESDFVLTELDAIPDPAFNVYWSGWDNSGSAPVSAVGIHHPAGDEKRISFANNPLTTTNYGETPVNPNSTHLRVSSWDSGTTEGGSSGSGLWNSAHHLVGTLSGGGASCEEPVASDWYGRMSAHWDGDGSADGQVKLWLDPDNTGATTIDGADICDMPTVNITSSHATAQLGQQIEFSANAYGGAGTYRYTWDFNNDGIIDSTERNPSYTYDYFYMGNVVVTVYDSTNCPGSDTVAIVINNAGGAELFPLNAEVPASWTKADQATASWLLESSDPAFEGTYSLKTALISDDQNAAIEVTHNFTDSNSFISFAYKVSSEQGYDELKFYIDNVEKGSWSGDIPWQTVYYPLTSGSHTLRWEYKKDATISEGADSAWIDGVTGLVASAPNATPVATVTAAEIEITSGENVYLDASQSSDPDGDALTFVWEQTSGPSISLTNSNAAITAFTAPDITSSTELTFTVTVTDTSANSDTAEITVTIKNPSGGGGGSLGILLLVFLLLSSKARKRLPGIFRYLQ